MPEIELFERLGLALTIGLLLGTERGWQMRAAADGGRVAGIRTFALIGLLGGFFGMIGRELGDVAVAAAFLAFTGLIVAAHIQRNQAGPADFGITTEVGELLTFALGIVAVRGDMSVAAAGAVVATTLLGMKRTLHAWVERLQQVELVAAIKLLLISVVMLPLLPDIGYGPGAALNPYKLWWVVVMIAGISFLGYFAIKLAGPRIGALLTGFFGGIASSTALTVTFSRLGRDNPGLQHLLSAGIAIACATMFLRILLIVLMLNPALLPPLAPAMGVMAAIMYAGAAILWLDRRGQAHNPSLDVANPFELGVALKFGAFLGLVLLLSRLLKDWFGTNGLYALAAASGLADVDAISVSMARMAGGEATLHVAALAVVLAAVVNTVVKAGMVATICGGAMAWRIGLVFAAALAGGGAVLVMGG